LNRDRVQHGAFNLVDIFPTPPNYLSTYLGYPSYLFVVSQVEIVVVVAAAAAGQNLSWWCRGSREHAETMSTNR
jgi:hypothetical protein